MLLRLLGGYTEPRWWRDGRSCREIGGELGISRVSAWKLWQPTEENVIQQACAEREGRRLFIQDCRQMELGEGSPFRLLQRRAVERFGIRTTSCFSVHPRKPDEKMGVPNSRVP